jgi:hypothetical protein
LVIFGGAEDSAAMRLRNDVYVLNHASGTTGEPVWSKLEPAGPAPENRAGAQAVLLAGGAQLLVFGGCTRGPYGCDLHQNDVWLLTGFGGGKGTPQWRRLEIQGVPPEGRSFHSVTLCPGPDDVLMFGGSGTKPWNDTWVLKFADTNRSGIWERLSIQGKPPAGRSSHAAGCLPSEHALVIFGGTRVSGPASDVWVLRPLGGAASPRWERISIPDPHPAPRETAHLIVDQKTGLVLVTGGAGIGQSFSDSWVLDLGPSSGWGEP